MAGLNKVILIGNLGKDPEVQTFETGRKKASFSLATTETYKDKEGVKQSITEWHNIIVWGPQADVVEKYLKKGSSLYVEGKIRSREYEAQDGQKRRITEINATNFLMLGGRSDDMSMQSQIENNSISTQSTSDVSDVAEGVTPADDLPF